MSGIDMIHVITPEFPPRLGGVADYTSQFALALEATGGSVCVWCMGQSHAEQLLKDSGVRPLEDGFPVLGLLRFGRKLARFPSPRRIILQWVPHGYGWLSMNVPFCVWIYWRSIWHRDLIEVVVHEACLPFGFGSWKTDLAAIVHRVMATILLAAANRVWVTIPEWERILRPFALGRSLPFDVLPVPSNIPFVDDPESSSALRKHYLPSSDGQLVGHFSRHSPHVKDLLLPVIPQVLATQKNVSFLLIGEGSDDFRRELLKGSPQFEARLLATGPIDSRSVSLHISACDLLCQPYADGICGRHGAAIGVLSHRKPIVTTIGAATEPFWAQDKAVELVDLSDPIKLVHAIEKLVSDPLLRQELGQKALSFYHRRLDVNLLIERILRDGAN